MPQPDPLATLNDKAVATAKELLVAMRQEQDLADERVEKWLNRCDQYYERMKDGG